jgi:hypothetical protein
MISPKPSYQEQDTVVSLIDMVTTLLHNQMVMQKDLQTLSAQLASTNALVDELLFSNDASDASSSLSGSPRKLYKITRKNLSKLAKGII